MYCYLEKVDDGTHQARVAFREGGTSGDARINVGMMNGLSGSMA